MTINLDRSRRLYPCATALLAMAAFALTTVESIAQQPGRQRTAARVRGLKVGRFPVDVHADYKVADGLPTIDVLAVSVLPSGSVYAGTAKGLARFDGHRWTPVAGPKGVVKLLAPSGNALLVVTASDGVWQGAGDSFKKIADLPQGTRDVQALTSLNENRAHLGTRGALYSLSKGRFDRDTSLGSMVDEIRQVAATSDGRVAVAAVAGLFLRDPNGAWKQQNAFAGDRSWLPRNVGGVAFDERGRLWFASRQGVGVLEKDKWTLYTGDDGLPYNDFTTLALGPNGVVWFGTTKGAIRFDGKNWSYRQGKRWLPDDNVRSIAIAADGTAWFATKGGVGKIEPRMMTLAEKARFYEDEIDKYHRRTPYEYVLEVYCPKPGDKSKTVQHDSDNDGLWTAMYGAGEAFAYAATKDPKAKERAKKAFYALRFLSQVTQGGKHPAPKGFPARSILPTSGENPNRGDSLERDERSHARDPLWKVLSPRWPTSADGKWYWKSDTSSDELDGHFFLYATYYDLVAETEEEKREARDVIAAVADHLIEHDFNLVDYDGTPTRWGVFGPKALNHNPRWTGARGLNSVSILSYLQVALHATGDKKYAEAFDRLAKDNAYLANIIDPKPQTGPSTGNHSDDEMAFMGFYDLIKYAEDPAARRTAIQSLARYWSQLEQPERNPFFNYVFAASVAGADGAGGRGGFRGFGGGSLDTCLFDALDQLKRFPLDRFDWAHTNSHRIDIVPIAFGRFGARAGPRGNLHSSKTLPVDERYFEHWNHDPWSLNTGGNGNGLGDGAVFLLPYYMGLYHGFIIEEARFSPA
jgi:hypothetical protein